MKKQFETIKIAALIRDFTLYPRHHVDEANVASMRRAIRAGAPLPPVVADRKTKKVTDGWNRIAAIEREGLDTVDVEWVTYADDAEMFLDAIARNATHGSKLTTFDYARCLIIAAELRLDDSAITVAMRCTVEFLEELRERKIGVGPDGPMPVKRTLAHLVRKQKIAAEAGMEVRPLPATAVRANTQANGKPGYKHITDAIWALNNAASVLQKDEKHVLVVTELRDLCDAWLGKVQREAA
jgi:hypothetical protein